MNNVKFLTIGIITLTVMSTSCEKENVLEPSANAQATKSKTFADKSGDEIDWVAVEAYADDLKNGIDPASLQWDTALLYIEAALTNNMRDGNPTYSFSELQVYDFVFEVQLSGDEISGSESKSLYNDVINEIANAQTASGLGSDAKLVLIDLELENIEFSGSVALVSGGMVHALDFDNQCPYQYSYKATNRLGKCGVFPSGTGDAVSALEEKLNNPNCNAAKDIVCYAYQITPAYTDGFSSSFLWSGTSPSTCLNTTDLATYQSNIESFITSNKPYGKLVKEVVMSREENQLGSYAHGVTVYYSFNRGSGC